MPTDLSNNLNYNENSIRNNGMTAILMHTNSNGEEETIELGPIDRIDMSTSSFRDTLNSDNNLFSPRQSYSEFFNLQENQNLASASITAPSSWEDSINNPTSWRTVTLNTNTSRIEPIRSSNERVADLMEDYIRNRNQDDKMFINHNTCQRKIEYNSIDDVIEFREYLDNIIKQHYQRR